jgi:anti-anti-sigma factor
MSHDDGRDGSIGIERAGRGVVARVGVAEPRDEDLERLHRLLGEAAREEGVEVVVLDLSGVSVLPSHGLGMLVKVSEECAGRGQRLRLAGLSPGLRETVRVTRLDRVLCVVGSVGEGLR